MELRDLPALSREKLLVLVDELQCQITELRASHEVLRAESNQLKRRGKRQAAPFSKRTRVAEPKSPGRKPGAVPFRDRHAPPLEAITELPVDVRERSTHALRVGGPLEEERVDCAYRLMIPARPRPQVT